MTEAGDTARVGEKTEMDDTSSRSKSPTLVSSDPNITTNDPLKSKRQEAIDQVSPRARAILLFVFCTSQFNDTALGSGMLLATSEISRSLNLELSQSVWIMTAYALSFAAFTLLAGRVSDLFSASIVFETALVLFGVIALVNSFIDKNKYAFLIVQTFGGMAAAFTISPSYNLIATFYPGEPKKMGLPGIAAALGSVIGLVLAGLCMMASWQWYLRLMAILSLGSAGLAGMLLPFSLPAHDPHDRLKRLDLPGALILGGALVCFLLALTEGPILGWSDPHFIAPFVVSMVAFIGFGVWEAVIPARMAALPMVIWKGKNAITAALITPTASAMVTVIQLEYSNYWQQAMGWSPLHVAAGLLPLCITAITLGFAVQKVSFFTTQPRWVVLATLPLNIAGWLLYYFSDTAAGDNRFWKFAMTSQVIGCLGGFLIYLSAGANFISSFPPESGGVAGAIVICIVQIGRSMYLAVAAGLSTPNVHDWRTTFGRIAFFGIPMNVVLTLQYVWFYKDIKSLKDEHESMRAMIRGDKQLRDAIPVNDIGEREKGGVEVDDVTEAEKAAVGVA